MNHYLNGLKFGMILQLAIGPLCIMVFNTANNTGFLQAFSLVIAVTLVDALYILLACLGINKLINNDLFKKFSSLIGGLVLLFFGISIILSSFKTSIIPELNLKYTCLGTFIQGLILTLSNPITIIFWGGILTAEIIKKNLQKKELFVFSLGLISSTILFLTMVALLGTVLSEFITPQMSQILNIITGAIILYFGLNMLFRKNFKNQ